MKEIYWATVIDNNDTELKAGRVKIKIPYLHDETEEELLPWAKQMTAFSGGSSEYGSSYIPEIDSLVWVIFENEEDLLKPFYIADVHLNDRNPHQLFADNIASSITGFASAYPDVKFNYYANGICTGVSSNETNPEIFTYHPKGTSIFIDKNGNINIKDANANTVTINATGIDIKDKNLNEVAMTSSGISLTGLGVAATVDNMVLGTKLQTVLQNLITAISAITTTNAVPGSPCTLNPASIAAFTAIAGTLSTILSAQNKTN